MLKLNKIGAEDILFSHSWPPINACTSAEKFFDKLSKTDFSELYARDQSAYYTQVMGALSQIYANYFGYEDALLYASDYHPTRELEIYKYKVLLEKELSEKILTPVQPVLPEHTKTPEAACRYLEALCLDNPGVLHPFFDFAAEEMTHAQWIEFLQLEVVRNEIVDDEVSLMIPGLQHAMKQVISSNLWDECGNGRISGFHTTWLRLLLTELSLWEKLKTYRKSLPWFAGLTSHSFAFLLTSLCGHHKAYGHFLITEGWVCPHFEKMVLGMNRVGLVSEEIQVYFTKHITIDPHHTQEMIEGIRSMRPQLNSRALQDILLGAHQAITAGTIMYDNLLKYFNQK